MSDWKNIRVIPCVKQTGESLSVIEQSRTVLLRASPFKEEGHANAHRFVLGNGMSVKPIDREHFMLPVTEEVIARR